MAETRGIRAGRAFVELGVSDKLTAGLKAAQRRLQAFGSGVRSIGQRLITAAATAAAPLAISAPVFASFEQSMARVRALTNASEKDFLRLSSEAKRLGETTVFSASQAADAMGFFALAGFSVEQILRSIGPTLNLAAAGQLEIAQAADIAAKIMAGMGIEADRLGEAVDVLTKAMTTANTDLLQLGDAMKFVGPIAKSAGIAFEEIVAAIQLLSNAGIQGEMAGTSLRGAILALTSPSQEAADKLKELGVRVLDAEGNVRPLADIIDDLNRAMEAMGSGERLEVLGRIFPARQAAGMAELLSQGADKLREYTRALGDAGGTASRIAGVQLNTLKGQATIFKSALEGLAIAVGESLVGALRAVAHSITRATAAMAQWVRENRSVVVIAAASILLVGALGVTLVAVGVAAQAAAFVLGGLRTILLTAKAALLAVGAAAGAILSPIGVVITAVAALGVAVLVSSGAAGAAIGWLGKQFAQLRDGVTRVMQGISDALAAGDVALAAKILWLSLKLVWQQGVAALNSAWLTARDFFITTAQKMWFGALAAAQTGFHALEVAWIETTSFLSKTWTKFTTGFQKIWESETSFVAKRMLEIQGLFDSSLNVDAAKQLVDEQLESRLSELESQAQQQLDERERKRQEQRRHAAETNEATLAEIGRQFEEAQESLRSGTDSRLAETQRQLDEARQRLEEAIAQARRSREEAQADESGGPRSPGQLVAALEDQLAGLGEAFSRGIEVRGTFSAEAVRGLAAGDDSAERTARATEQTARHTKRLVEASTKGLAFG
ncbi:MAG: phage tail tape measure protein [Phycisphaerales bacterium]|nr:phage tail tape measure protein [Phycisphaerales bacterium]